MRGAIEPGGGARSTTAHGPGVRAALDEAAECGWLRLRAYQRGATVRRPRFVRPRGTASYGLAGATAGAGGPGGNLGLGARPLGPGSSATPRWRVNCRCIGTSIDSRRFFRKPAPPAEGNTTEQIPTAEGNSNKYNKQNNKQSKQAAAGAAAAGAQQQNSKQEEQQQQQQGQQQQQPHRLLAAAALQPAPVGDRGRTCASAAKRMTILRRGAIAFWYAADASGAQVSRAPSYRRDFDQLAPGQRGGARAAQLMPRPARQLKRKPPRPCARQGLSACRSSRSSLERGDSCAASARELSCTGSGARRCLRPCLQRVLADAATCPGQYSFHLLWQMHHAAHAPGPPRAEARCLLADGGSARNWRKTTSCSSISCLLAEAEGLEQVNILAHRPNRLPLRTEKLRDLRRAGAERLICRRPRPSVMVPSSSSTRLIVSWLYERAARGWE